MKNYTDYLNENSTSLKRIHNDILKSMGVEDRNGKIDKSKLKDKMNDMLFKIGIEVHKIKGKTKKIKVSDLAPSQNEIFLDQIISKLLEKTQFVDDALKGKIKDEDMLISSDNHIIDGHHRWAAAFILNPNCKIKCTKINIPFKKAIPIFDKLLKEIDAGDQNQNGDYLYNIFDLVKKNRDELKNVIVDIFKKNDKSKVKKLLDKIKDECHSDLHPINYIIQNIHKLPNPQNKLMNKKDMPQLSDDEINEILK